jgi:hypothetical protein
VGLRSLPYARVRALQHSFPDGTRARFLWHNHSCGFRSCGNVHTGVFPVRLVLWIGRGRCSTVCGPRLGVQMDRSRRCGHGGGPGVSIPRRLERRSSCVLPLHWPAGLPRSLSVKCGIARTAWLPWSCTRNSSTPRTPGYWITRPPSRRKTGSSQQGSSSLEELTSSRTRCPAFGRLQRQGWQAGSGPQG